MQLRQIAGEPAEMLALQKVFEWAPEYSSRILGHPPGPAEAQSCFTKLPPDKGYEDKFCYGIYDGAEMVGFVDLIRGYPDNKTATLGLLLLVERVQGHGHGRSLYQKIEDLVRDWAGFEKIRLSVVATNSQVIPFWKKMGFKENGERKPYLYDKVHSEHIVFEKPIQSRKSRYTMGARLSEDLFKAEASAKWTSRTIRAGDADCLGVLMLRSYRGSIDDEGETPEQFRCEMVATLQGKWGAFVPKASFLIEVEGKPASATIVTLWKGKPLLAYSMTDPEWQGNGMGCELIRKTMSALSGLGYREIGLGVTVGNAAAEHIYRKLGFSKLSQP